MKQTLIKSCLLLFISILLINCEKDDSYNQDTNIISQTQEKGYTVKKITLNEVKQSSLVKQAIDNIEQQLDYNKLNKTKSTKTEQQNNTSTSAIASNTPIKSKDNTFTILTDEILQVSTDSTDVYTFRIETPTKPESDFENFVIHKNSDESIAYYIYRYESIGSEITALNFSREEVNSDQINVGDFDDYLPSVMMWDEEARCWINVTMEGGNLVVDISDCTRGNTASSGIGDSGGGGGVFVGGWNYFNPDGNTNNGCIRTRSYVDSSGNTQTDTEYGVPCPNSSSDGSDSSSGTDSSDSGGNSTNTWPNVDPLHGDFGGGTSPSNNSNTSDTNEGDVVGVLAPSPLELATNAFFDNLDQDKKDCLAAGFNQFKNDITNFFEDNQPVRPIGYDGPVIDSNITDFASAAIDAHCSGEIESLDEVIYVIESAEDPIENMEEYLDCFDTTQSASLTIYVNEPIDGTNSLIGRDRVGHTFVSIQQGSNMASYGFYPNSMLSSLVGGTQGVMEDNSNTEYDVSITINNISPSNLQKIITLSKSYAISDYHLSQRNCTDMGIALGNLAGLPIPECNANSIYFFGSTPGRLGEYMRNLTLPTGVTRNITGGNSPDNNCN